MHPLESLRCVLHAAPAGGKPGGEPPAGDLVTLAEFRLSDPVAESHGLKVEPIPPGADELRRQQWQDHTTEPRSGPVYLLRFDGRGWRFDRSSVGWGAYDAVHRTWPQPDGRVYLVNRFGLWVQWPKDVTKDRINRLVGELVEAPDGAPELAVAAGALASMGQLAVPALAEAEGQASTERSRRRLAAARAEAERVARGEEDAVPVVAGRWRFFQAYPQATMPDGRFVFFCQRAVDVLNGGETRDCLVFFDPVADAFEVRAIDRAQWNTTDFYDKRAMEAPVKNLDGTVADLAGGLWVTGGYRVGHDGRLTRLVPPGLNLWPPHFVDPDGRVYFRPNVPNERTIWVFRPAGDADPGAGAAVAVRPPPPKPDGEREVHLDNVPALFRQPDLKPPWNGWAVRRRGGEPDVLLRLDGPEPTAVNLPPGLRRALAVVPLDGGCVAAGQDANSMGAAGFWDGKQWDVAPDVKTLIERHGERLAKAAPARAFVTDTSGLRTGVFFEHQLLLASDGRGGLWLAEDANGRRLWHWDGRAFTDVWSVLPLGAERNEDGAVLTAAGGRVLVVQVESNMDTRPGAYWAVWHVKPEDLRGPNPAPQGTFKPGLRPRLLAALGPNTVLSRGLWADRQGWVWSPAFAPVGGGPGGPQWFRKHDNLMAPTAVGRAAWTGAFVEPPGGPVWFVTGRGGGEPAVWADVGPPPGEDPRTLSRMAWVGANVPGMGAAAQLAAAPDGRVYLLHEAGCSLLRLRKLAAGEGPKLPTRNLSPAPTTRPANTGAGAGDAKPAERWEIREVARRPWDGPRNDFGRIAFDETGVWFLPNDGPLIRAPLPRE